MHQSTQQQVLAEGTNGYISYCSCCHDYQFVYKNLVLIFQYEELVRFCEWLITFRYSPETYIPLKHGKCRVYKSPLSNLVIAFTQVELDEVEILLAHLQLITEARQLVQGRELPS